MRVLRVMYQTTLYNVLYSVSGRQQCHLGSAASCDGRVSSDDVSYRVCEQSVSGRAHNGNSWGDSGHA